MTYTMCMHSKAKVFVSTFALHSAASLLHEQMSTICLHLRVVCSTSASGVTDMGLLKSRDVLLIGALGEVQESAEY